MLFSRKAFPFACARMSELVDLTRRLDARMELSPGQIAVAAKALASPETGDELKGAFLTALALKGETAAEVAAFAREFRAVAIDPGVGEWAAQAIDIVGTGGDHAGGFNISSLVVLTLASAGVPVMKHGNRGITSKCGSADLLAALGVNLEASHEKIRGALRELGYAFFFAPAYHPTFKHIGPVRKALAAKGQRTVFNILGPLINPGRPAHVILGVFSEAWVSKLADALDALGTTAGLAAHGVLGEGRGIDELTTATPNRVRGAGRLRGIDGMWDAREHGFSAASFDDLKGGDLAQNLAITEAILAGRGPAGLVDTIVFNVATAMWVCGRTASVADGVAHARELLLGGAVQAKIAATREFYRS
jgi:anthranilate phosphoribosyltransferase